MASFIPSEKYIWYLKNNSFGNQFLQKNQRNLREREKRNLISYLLAKKVVTKVFA